MFWIRSALLTFLAVFVATQVAPACGSRESTVEDFLNQAQGFLAIGAPDAAIEAYRKAQRLEPKNNVVALGLMKARHLARILPDAITAGEIHPVNWAPVRKAIAAVREGVVRLHNPSFKVTFVDYMQSPPKERTDFASETLWNFYQRTVNDERLAEAEPEAEALVRELLLLLLAQGLNMDLPFNEGKHPASNIIVGTPLGKAVHDRRDVEMVDALLDSNAQITAHYAVKGFDEGPTMVERYSVNGVPSVDYSTGCTFTHLLANGAIQIALVRELYQVYNAKVAGHDMETYVKKNRLDRLEPYSPTLHQFLEDLRADKPKSDFDMTRAIVKRIDQEIEGYIAHKLFSNPRFNFTDLELNVMVQRDESGELQVTAQYDRNPLVIAVFMGRVAMVKALNDELQRRKEAGWPGIEVFVGSDLPNAVSKYVLIGRRS